MKTASLDSLIRLARSGVDARRRDLAACLRRETELADVARAIAATLASEQAVLDGDPGMAATAFGPFVAATLARRDEVEAQRKDAAAATATARAALAEAHRQLKSLETVAERRAARSAALRSKREQGRLDEVAGQGHHRSGHR